MANPLGEFLVQELEALRQRKLFRKLRILEGRQLPQATFDGRSLVNLSSNNYLGFAMRFSDELFKEGVFAQGIEYPTVPEAKFRIRTIVMATHTREQLEFSLTF